MSKCNQWQMKLGVGKSWWPELLGTKGDVAVEIMVRENPRVTAIILPEGSVVTPDFRCDRVRVFVNNQDIVNRMPKIG